MRAACRKFIDAGGPYGRDFVRAHSPYQADGFSLALGDLRTSMGYQLAAISTSIRWRSRRNWRRSSRLPMKTNRI